LLTIAPAGNANPNISRI